MRFLRPSEVPVTGHDRVFDYSRHHAVGGLLLTILGTGVIAYLAWLKQPALGYFVVAFAGFFLLLVQKMFTARFHPENWLVRLTYDGMFIKFRSYLNGHFADDEPTVVFIAHSEIRSARYIVEKQEIPDRDEKNRPTTTTKTNKLVELELAGDTKALAEALLREKRYAIDGKITGVTTRYRHLPLRLASAEKLQIEWAVVPKAQTLLDALTRHTLVRPAEESKKDFVNLEGLSQKEQESRLLELAESGDKIGAIAMARRLYGYDLSQAKDFVEGLSAKQI